LRIGHVYSITKLGENLVFCQTPSLNSAQIKKLKSGSQLTILSAPVDADNFFWRKVRLEDGTEGWVKEVGGWFAPVTTP
jgi:hypothetical protein